MISKFEKDGSFIFTFSNLTLQEKKLIEKIEQLMSEQQEQEKKMATTHTTFDFTKEGARKRAEQRAKQVFEQRKDTAIKHIDELSDEEFKYILENGEGVPF